MEKVKQYVYEIERKNGEVSLIVMNKKFPIETVLEYLNTIDNHQPRVIKCDFVKEVEKGNWHWCQMCGDIVVGNDDDILCEDCCMTFGHYRFSQL